MCRQIGKNEVHGTAFHFIRRHEFEPVFARQRHSERNQSGGSLGGAIVKGKLFYFETSRATAYAASRMSRTVVPTKRRAGDSRQFQRSVDLNRMTLGIPIPATD